VCAAFICREIGTRVKNSTCRVRDAFMCRVRALISAVAFNLDQCVVLSLCYGLAAIRRLLKIIGLFVKEPYKRVDILQKRPIILRSLLIEATPQQCVWFIMFRVRDAFICRVRNSDMRVHVVPRHVCCSIITCTVLQCKCVGAL